MKDFIWRTIRKIRRRLKLRKIENAIGIKMTKRQRRVILSCKRPTFEGWERASGKTTAACIWTMIWLQKPISIQNESNVISPWMWHENVPAIPDPDVDSIKRLKHTLNYYGALLKKCLDAGVDVKATIRR